MPNLMRISKTNQQVVIFIGLEKGLWMIQEILVKPTEAEREEFEKFLSGHTIVRPDTITDFNDNEIILAFDDGCMLLIKSDTKMRIFVGQYESHMDVPSVPNGSGTYGTEKDAIEDAPTSGTTDSGTEKQTNSDSEESDSQGRGRGTRPDPGVGRGPGKETPGKGKKKRGR